MNDMRDNLPSTIMGLLPTTKPQDLGRGRGELLGVVQLGEEALQDRKSLTTIVIVISLMVCPVSMKEGRY